MPPEVQEMWNICRFCLTQEEDVLAPVTTILDSYLTIENVQRFTGVSIQLHGNVQHAVCVYCTYRLQESVAFLSACMHNDTYLRKLCGLEGKTSTRVRNKSNVNEDQDPLDVKVEQKSKAFDECPSSQQKKEKKEMVECNEPEIDTPLPMPSAAAQNTDTQPTSSTEYKQELAEAEEEFYSANYIEPGVSTYSETDECESDGDIKSPSDTANNRNGRNAKSTSTSQTRPKQRITFTTKEGFDLFALTMSKYKKALCDFCGKLVSNISSHIATHTKETNFACPHCPVKMTDNANLVRHINAVHLKLVVKTCQLCGKGFTHKNTYLSHMRAHHGIGKMHECKDCARKFGHPSSLRDHYKRAHSSQNYSCAACGMCFKLKRSLQVHQRVHSSDQPYVCREDQCTKRFKSTRARRNHELTHRGALFKCTICDKSYSYKSLLNMHVRKMHSNDNDSSE